MAYIADGTGDFIAFADNAVTRVDNGDFTVAIWAKASSDPGGGGETLLFNKGGDLRYEVSTFAGNLSFVVDDDVNKTDLRPAFSELIDGVWHLYIFERDAGTTLKIFLDGNTQRGTTTDFTGDGDDSSTLNIVSTST